MAIIDAYRKDNGKKVRIPAHYLEHPVLGKPFAKTPSQRARDQRPRPATSAPLPAAQTAPVVGDPEKE